jgi:hypothetical protein
MSTKKIIIINGSNTAGKDSFVQLFTKHAKTDVFEWSTINTVKDVADVAFGWNGEKDDMGRRLLSDLKDAWARYNDGPFNEIRSKIAKYDRDFDQYVLFVHVREPAEIKKIVDAFPGRVTTIFIYRDGMVPANNHADQNVSRFGYTYYINNSGDLESLEIAARDLAGVFDGLCSPLVDHNQEGPQWQS